MTQSPTRGTKIVVEELKEVCSIPSKISFLTERLWLQWKTWSLPFKKYSTVSGTSTFACNKYLTHFMEKGTEKPRVCFVISITVDIKSS